MVKKLFHIFWHLTLAVHVLGQTGFISIDCGNERTPYTDVNSQISYTSDSPYIETGVNMVLPDPSSVPIMQYRTVRSFPSGDRNCYSLDKLNSLDAYLVRASFMYGNYDGLNRLPEFDVYLGIDLWYSVKFDNLSHMVSNAIITVPTTTMIAVCLVNKGSGIPFISSLEFRQWPNSNSIYPYFNGRIALMTWMRVDYGSNKALRFLDKACIKVQDGARMQESPWRLGTVTQVEQVKIIISVVPIFACTIIFNTILAQLQTFSVQQGRTMDCQISKNF